jgi:hypothetical protein
MWPFSCPACSARAGVVKTFMPDLDASERAALKRSAEIRRRRQKRCAFKIEGISQKGATGTQSKMRPVESAHSTPMICSLGDDPKLELNQFTMQPREFALVFLAAELLLTFRGALILRFLGFVQTFCRSHPFLTVRSLHHGRACLVTRRGLGPRAAARRRHVAV